MTQIDSVWQQAKPTMVDTIGNDVRVATKNFGLPSLGSAEIAVRQGGLRPRVTLNGGQIPAKATTPIHVDSISPTDGWTQYTNAGSLKMHGALAKVPGTLQHTLMPGVDDFSFIPDAPLDTAVPLPPGSTFAGDDGVEYRGCFEIIWAGANNQEQPAAIVRDIASMVTFLSGPPHYLIIGTIPTTSDALAKTYGPRFVDLRSWLVSDGLAAAGVAPTAADTEAVAAGIVPPSLTVDGTHFTQAAYTAVGHHLASLIAQTLD
ncbi:hypothetical protein [Mycolicibacterium sp. CBMA 234]|uniref:hypothetical protein n=1 Tax=Mycolicibacterium sp. CBMA 234 TaxID=1918495 RepID=UPI0012DF06DB|nr:hypothetical protein [Mycolicibacterium sp. CBMA 234]